MGKEPVMEELRGEYPWQREQQGQKPWGRNTQGLEEECEPSVGCVQWRRWRASQASRPQRALRLYCQGSGMSFGDLKHRAKGLRTARCLQTFSQGSPSNPMRSDPVSVYRSGNWGTVQEKAHRLCLTQLQGWCSREHGKREMQNPKGSLWISIWAKPGQTARVRI